jgi:hypothetical protein
MDIVWDKGRNKLLPSFRVTTVRSLDPGRRNDSFDETAFLIKSG